MSIHPTAIIDPRCEIDSSVIIGPYCVLIGDVKIDAGTVLQNHVTVGSEYGQVRIGKNNVFFPGGVIGGAPQDLKYNNEPTRLEVGDGNTIREFVTLNLGTTKENGVTRLGNENLLMAYTHVAHDCELANHIVVANSCQFAGHVKIEDRVTVGGCVGVSQFTRLGKLCYIGGNSTINKDILPFSIAEGTWAVCRATNKVGLQRAGLEKEEVQSVHQALRTLLKGGHTTQAALEILQGMLPQYESLKYLIQFVQDSKKGIAI